MNIAAYCRVSTDSSDQLNSLEAQKEFFAEYTRTHGHDLVRLYADEGLTGTRLKNRREFQRLMEEAGTGVFDMVVVKDISRFARNTVDFLQSIRALKAKSIETVFVTNNQTVLGNSEFILTIFGALAQEESANTSKRVKFGKRINAEKGRVPNLVFGYDKTPGDYFHLVANPREAEVVRRIFSWYTLEGHGAGKIAQLLNSEGLPTKRGCRWSQNAVCRILTNPIYIGQVVNGRQEVADFLTGARRTRGEEEWLVAHKPELAILEEEQFLEAGRILAERSRRFKGEGKRHSGKHLFSTLIKCPDCGYSFRRMERTYRNTYVRWVCSGRNAKGTGSCENRTAVDEAELLRSIREYLTQFLRGQPAILEKVIQELAGGYRRQAGTTDRRELERKRDKLVRGRKKYLELYTDDLISREELESSLSQLNRELDGVEAGLRHIQGEMGEAGRAERILRGTFRQVEDLLRLEELSNAQLRRLIREIRVDREGRIDIYIAALEPGTAKNVLLCDTHT